MFSREMTETTGHPFRFEIDVEVFEKAGPDGTKDRRIGGIVSTDHLDRQEETLLQDGLDFSPFMKGGWFNDNHDKSTEALVGYPTAAQLRELPDGRKGWYVEGYLLKGHDRADRLWDLANALQKTDRRLGFSVEGQVVDRDPKNPRTVRKAVVREVAITRCPVNTQTELQVLAKSLAAGTGPAPKNTPVSGSMGGMAVMAPQHGEWEHSGELLYTDQLRKKRKKKMKKSEAVQLLMKLNPKVTQQFAERVADYALRWHPENGG